MQEYKPGQKWISQTEPELGMGRILNAGDRTVTCYFDLVEEERTYAGRAAPLVRVRFAIGDSIRTRTGIHLTVTGVSERDGLLAYYGDHEGTPTIVPESELDPDVRFSKPEDRLFTRQIDDNARFNLRYHSLVHRANLAASLSRGLYGPRVSLVPHQLYIASEVARRFAPRVLLADETGLGKTIEAGLVIHQQLQTGRASRVLVIVPPALTFQWFVEMIRRFNLPFILLDEQRCEWIESDNAEAPESEVPDSGTNPFEAQQLAICSLELFTGNPHRLQQATDSGWDLIVVDEAHHLTWHPDGASVEYQAVEKLSASATGLILLTATPEQLGKESHFARLRLLDPDRYRDYRQFRQEEAEFSHHARLADRLLDGSDKEKATARQEIIALLNQKEGPTTNSDDADLIAALLDRHGTGRVLFRNVRSSVAGFPERIPVIHRIDAAWDEFCPELSDSDRARTDLRVDWLVKLVSGSSEKYLVICAHRQTAVTLESSLRSRTSLRTTVFHEGLDLVARDRAASYFADTWQGAQVMVCSEIGSEGRNFQFASQLVLFDLPPGPDLVEQRIGRLDRIGQNNAVHIHVPCPAGGKARDLFRWYHEGLNLFREPNAAAQGIFDEFFEEFLETDDMDAFIDRMRELNRMRCNELKVGRDRLLELNSHRPEVSGPICRDIALNEGGPALEAYMERSFETFGLDSKPLGDGVFHVKPGDMMTRHTSVSMETRDHFHYPELPEDGLLFTCDRQTALGREDTGFLTWEHPLVQQALDVVITDFTGNSTMIVIRHENLEPGKVFLEILHVIHCIAPAAIMADRYLPPGILRTVISEDLSEISELLPFSSHEDALDVPRPALFSILESRDRQLRDMLAAGKAIALEKLAVLQSTAMDTMLRELDTEIQRLDYLADINPNVHPAERDALKERKEKLVSAITKAEPGVDALRVIVSA